MTFEKSINLFERVPKYLLNIVFAQLFNIFLELLLCKKNFPDTFNMDDFFSDFRYIAKYENLIKSNFCLAMYERTYDPLSIIIFGHLCCLKF